MRAILLAMALTAAVVPVAVVQRAEPAEARPYDPPQVEVVGGTRAERHEFPFVVRLSNGCAGTLVQPQFVLTAAHCVGRSGPTRSLRITAGSSDLRSAETVSVSSAEVRRAPGYRDVTTGDDWAVIRLSRALSLPVAALAKGSGLDSGTFTVIGWGATREGRGSQSYLRKAQVPYVSDAACNRLFAGAGYDFTASDMICAGDLDHGGRDACQGDSGGPLLRRDGGRWVQVGIVSWGVGCGRAEFPGVYSQVSKFGPDISEAIEGMRSRG